MANPPKLLFSPQWSSRRVLLGAIASPLLVLLTTLALHAVEQAMAIAQHDETLRPFGIAFIIPVVLTALLGGWRCGALTLALSLVSTYAFLMGHAAHGGIIPAEITELAFITLVGGAVLVAVELQQRNLRLLREIALISEQRQSFFRDVLVNVTDGKLNLVDSTAHLPGDFADQAGLLALRRDNLGVFRKMVAEASKKAGLTQERIDDLITAASECAMNAVVHGGGGTGTVTWDGADKVMVRGGGYRARHRAGESAERHLGKRLHHGGFDGLRHENNADQRRPGVAAHRPHRHGGGDGAACIASAARLAGEKPWRAAGHSAPGSLSRISSLLCNHKIKEIFL